MDTFMKKMFSSIFFSIDTLLTQAHIYELAWSKQHRVLYFYTTSDASLPDFLEGPKPDFWRRAQAHAGTDPKIWKGQEKLSFFDSCIYQKAQHPAFN